VSVSTLAFLCTRYRLVLTFISHIPMPPGLALPFNTTSLAQTCTGQTSNLSGCQRSARRFGSTDRPSFACFQLALVAG
jgi:hypothetical protein